MTGRRCRIDELETRIEELEREVEHMARGDQKTRQGLPVSLSGRQAEVLRRLLSGQRVLTMARDLGVSPSTVRNHLSLVFRKFGVTSQQELIELLAPRPGVPAPAFRLRRSDTVSMDT